MGITLSWLRGDGENVQGITAGETLSRSSVFSRVGTVLTFHDITLILSEVSGAH